MNIEKLLEMLRGEKTKENKEKVDVKKELTDIIAQLEEPNCAILVTNENVGVMGTGIDILTSISSLINDLLKQGFPKDILQKAFDIAFETYEEEN